MEKIHSKQRINFKRLTAQEQGLILEPYVYYLFSKVGQGKRNVLQNVELIDREGMLKCQVGRDTIRYKPAPAPTMELDVLMFTDLKHLPSILQDLEEHGFRHEFG